MVGFVVPGRRGVKAGIREGDQVVQIDDIDDPTWEDVMMKEVSSAKQAMQVWVKRNGERLHFAVTPRYDEKQGVGPWRVGCRNPRSKWAATSTASTPRRRPASKRATFCVSINGHATREALPVFSEVIEQTKARRSSRLTRATAWSEQVTLTPAQREIEGQDALDDRRAAGAADGSREAALGPGVRRILPRRTCNSPR